MVCKWVVGGQMWTGAGGGRFGGWFPSLAATSLLVATPIIIPVTNPSPIHPQFIPNCPNRWGWQWQRVELCTWSHRHVHPGHQLWVASATEGQSDYVGDYVSDYVGGHSAPGLSSSSQVPTSRPAEVWVCHNLAHGDLVSVGWWGEWCGVCGLGWCLLPYSMRGW